MGIANHTANALDLLGGTFDFYDSAGILRSQISATSTTWTFSTQTANQIFSLLGGVSTGTTRAGLVLSGFEGTTGNATATSGNQIAVNVSGDSTYPDAFAPTSGTATFEDLFVNPKINQTGGANGTVTILGAYPLNTAVVGTEYLLGLGTASAQGNGATLTNKFTVDSNGNAVAAGNLNCGTATSSSCVITGAGSTSGTATLTWPAVAGTTTNPIAFSNVLSVIQTTATPGYGFATLTDSGLASVNSAGDVEIFDDNSGSAHRELSFTKNRVMGTAGTCYGWTSSASDPSQGSDTGFARVSPAVVQLGNCNSRGGLLLSYIQSAGTKFTTE